MLYLAHELLVFPTLIPARIKRGAPERRETLWFHTAVKNFVKQLGMKRRSKAGAFFIMVRIVKYRTAGEFPAHGVVEGMITGTFQRFFFENPHEMPVSG